MAVRQFLTDLHRHVCRDRAADLGAPFAADLAIARTDTEQNCDAFGFAPVRRTAHTLSRRNHLLDLGGRNDVLEHAEAPLRLVHGVEVSETAAQDRGLRLDLLAVRQFGREGSRRAVEPGYGSTRLDIDVRRLLDPGDHATDGIPGPLARWHKLCVARQNRRAAQSILFLHDYGFLAHRGKTVSRSQTSGSATYDQNWFTHFTCSIIFQSTAAWEAA